MIKLCDIGAQLEGENSKMLKNVQKWITHVWIKYLIDKWKKGDIQQMAASSKITRKKCTWILTWDQGREILSKISLEEKIAIFDSVKRNKNL